MKINKLLIVILLALMASLIVFPVASLAQTYIDVPPGFSTLNDAIKNNTNPNVIFRLKRGPTGVYLLNGSIEVTSPLRIEAEAGTGLRPQLIPAVGSGGVTDIPFRIKADLSLKGLYVTSKDELGAYLSQILRISADNVTLNIDDCFLENTAQSIIRTDNKLAKIYLRNSTLRNAASDWNNGRGVDDRGVDIDILYVENCTIYSIASRFLRDGGGYIKKAFFNHNTFVHTGFRLLDVGECADLTFTNNLVINCGFLGREVTSTDCQITMKPLTNSVFQGVTQKFLSRNNNFMISSDYYSAYPSGVVVIPWYDDYTKALVDASGFDNTNIAEYIEFKTPPPSLKSVIPLYWNDPLRGSGTTAINIRSNGTYDFSYATTYKSYSYGTDGKPLGATSWFGINTNVDAVTELPTDFILEQNYPNPFNPTTNIKYSLPVASNVKVEIFNTLGQLVNTIVNKYQNAGTYNTTWNGTDLYGNQVSTGVYIYKLTTDKFVSAKKMMLIK